MSVSDISVDALRAMGPVTGVPRTQPRLHRIGAVRRQQGVSLRRVALLMKADMRTLRVEEDEHSDMLLSRLRAWQQVLDVPLIDLLVESDGALSAPVMQRARLIRVMKTVAAIIEKTESPQIRRLAQTLAEQLCEVMPELNGVGPWHSVGQRRTLNEFGRIVERPYSDDLWRDLE